MSNSANPAIAHLYPGRATGLVTRVAPGKRNFTPKFPRPEQRRRRRASPFRQGIIAALALAVIVTLGVFGADAYMTQRDVAIADAATANNQIYMGSVLFFPNLGNRCRQLAFDNRDGQFADNGSVDCTRAVSESAKDTAKSWSAARTQGISKGFH